MLLDQSPLAEHVSALVVDQLRVTDSPIVVEVADAENTLMTGCDTGASTTTDIDDTALFVPAVPEQVNVKL